MKIIAASRTPQQSLGKADSKLLGAGSATGGAANLAQTVGELSQGVSQFAAAQAQVEDIKANRQSQQSNLFMQKSDAEFWEYIGGREFLDVDEIPIQFQTEGMAVKGRVASAEVIPQMYEAHIQKQLTEASKIIDNKKLRSDWEVKARDTATQRQSRIQIEANGAIEDQFFKDQITNYENAIDADRPDLALQIANDMKGPPEAIEKFKRGARKSSETTDYERVIIAEDERGIDSALEHLTKDPPDYRDDGGELNREERIAWIQKLRREKARMGQGNAAHTKAQLAMLKRQMRITQANSLKGKFTDPTELAELQARAAAMDDGSLTDDRADLDMSIAFTELVNLMTLNDGPNRQAFLAEVDGLNIPDFEKDQLVLRLEQANQSFTTGIRSDMMQTAADAGFMELSPVSVQADLTNPESVQNVVQQLAMRLDDYHTAEANYGDGQGPLTKEEASALSTQLENLSAKGKQGFLLATAANMGEDANQFYEQLSFNGASKSLAVAGMATLNGRESVSEAILRGGEYKRENPEDVKSLTKLLNLKISKELGSAYRNNPAYLASLKEGVADAYIGMALTAGEDLTKVNDGGIFSKGTFTNALEGATGGLVKQNGEMIAPPAYGTTQREWNSWINGLAPDYIEQLGDVDGLDSRGVVDEIRSGDIQVKDTGKMGEYILTDPNGVPLRNSTTGNAFVLPYDPNAKKDIQVLDMYGDPVSERTLKATEQQKEDLVEYRRKRSDERVEQLRIHRLRTRGD